MARHSMLSLLTAVAIAASATVASADSVFVTTGHTGAQVQLDVNHTQYWTYTVTADVPDVSGGLFTMKRGSSSTASVLFEIFEGTINEWNSVPALLSVTKTPASFTQSFAPIYFQGGPITLFAGTTYTAVLSSGAADMQSKAYFIKGLEAGRLAFADSSGDLVNTGGQITDVPGAVPLPAAAPAGLALLGLASLARRLRRRDNTTL